ncbi:MAG: dockerin type I repeat-containing protein [Clostridia bacterium]|nr:dockerin type I repeat-containing protein [Clostridia bacterium]
MKKLLSLIFAVIMIFTIIAVPVQAENDEEKFSHEEISAGFSFKYIYVLIKKEYYNIDIISVLTDNELVSRVEEPYVIDDGKPHERIFMVYLKEQKAENIITLYRQMKQSEFVSECSVDYILYYFPIYPENAEEIGYFQGYYAPFIDPKNENYVNMLRNEYYKKYYNDLLSVSVFIFNQFRGYMGDVDYISYFADNYMHKDKNYVTLIFDNVFLPEYVGAERDYNMSVLEKYFNEDEILYVSDYTLSAVVEISKEKKDIIMEIEELAFVGDAFFTIPMSGLAEEGRFTLGNVTGDEEETSLNTPLKRVTAADARMILRYSAKLEKASEEELKRFYFCADMNLDGKINSADARLALRTAAKLEEEYVLIFGTKNPWTDIMSQQRFYDVLAK